MIVDYVTGQADVSGNGDIRIRQVTGGAVVKNIGGDIRVGELGSGTVDLYTPTGEAGGRRPPGHRRLAGHAQLNRPGAQLPRGPRRPRAVRLDRQGR